jgi:DNA mismatch repair ATPase MutS
MTTLYSVLIISLLLNIVMGWYIARLLKKFLFVSQNITDLYLIIKSFAVFVQSMYSMDSYHGEPMIQELIFKLKEVLNEMEYFREIFEHTIDEELEEELDAAQEIEKE